MFDYCMLGNALLFYCKRKLEEQELDGLVPSWNFARFQLLLVYYFFLFVCKTSKTVENKSIIIIKLYDVGVIWLKPSSLHTFLAQIAKVYLCRSSLSISYPRSLQDDGTMDQDVDGDGAINLSTSQRPSAATTPNDGLQVDDFQHVSHLFHFISGSNTNKSYKSSITNKYVKNNKGPNTDPCGTPYWINSILKESTLLLLFLTAIHTLLKTRQIILKISTYIRKQ